MGNFVGSLLEKFQRNACIPKDNPIIYARSQDYTPAGHQRPGFSDYWKLGLKSMIGTEAETRKLLFPVIQNRLKDMAASQKVNAFRVEVLLERYPQWSEYDIYDFYNMFKTFDNNGTGVGEISLMNTALEQLGDTMSVEDRMEFLTSVDEDATGSVDFEEFLVILNKLREDSQALGYQHPLSVTFDALLLRTQILYNMSVYQLVEAGFI